MTFPAGFLWGAATSAHQTEGNNFTSDWWAFEHSGHWWITEPSGDAVDSYHRWPEDMDLLAAAGFSDYRFSIEWARIEPAPGEFSDAQIDHYRAMVSGARARGLRPLVTLHHFTNPRWFDERGGWGAPDAPELFGRYVDAVAPVIDGHVRHVCTINEPYLCTLFDAIRSSGPQSRAGGLPAPDDRLAGQLISAHRTAVARVRAAHPDVKVGWSIACQDYQPEPGADAACAEYAYPRETRFVEASIGDDWIGVQAYTRTRIGMVDGVAARLPPPAGAATTLTGWEYHPPAVGEAVRQVAAATGGMAIIVTENGIATADDTQRIAYTQGALASLRAAIDDGIDVGGYFHWSLLDNYEWGGYGPTFGLVAVDRTTFERRAKPSLQWLGSVGPDRKDHAAPHRQERP